ncbi:hypothetical protein ACQPU1_12220 [Clostridium paraputrificum]|uniref:hypothetical protein n=1 Tax=Clostridium paraputrificum TaxID=29363 RepID=UPI003D32B366
MDKLEIIRALEKDRDEISSVFDDSFFESLKAPSKGDWIFKGVYGRNGFKKGF